MAGQEDGVDGLVFFDQAQSFELGQFFEPRPRRAWLPASAVQNLLVMAAVVALTFAVLLLLDWAGVQLPAASPWD